jgi:hypothetical protein
MTTVTVTLTEAGTRTMGAMIASTEVEGRTVKSGRTFTFSRDDAARVMNWAQNSVRGGGSWASNARYRGIINALRAATGAR